MNKKNNIIPYKLQFDNFFNNFKKKFLVKLKHLKKFSQKFNQKNFCLAFTNLYDFNKKKKATEALGFYIISLVLFIALGGFFAGIAGFIVGSEKGFESALKILNSLIIITIILLAAFIIKKKELNKNAWYIVWILLSGLLAYSGGAILGLIPIAFLTTR